MKKVFAVFILIRAPLRKLAGTVFHPLKGIPVPDFNYQYDTTIL